MSLLDRSRRKDFFSLIMLSWFLTSCASATSFPPVSSPAMTTTPEMTPSPSLVIENDPPKSSQSTLTATIHSPDIATVIPSSTPNLLLTTSSSVSIFAPPGLMYNLWHSDKSDDGIWLVGTDSSPIHISSSLFARMSPTHQEIVYDDCYSTWLSNLVTGQTERILTECAGWPVWSSDGKSIFYELENDVWMIDLQSKEPRNLSNTPDYFEDSIQIWPARPDILLFYSQPIDGPSGEGWFGYPSILYLGKTRYTVLTTSPSHSVALSPNGQAIAYADDEGTWIYTDQSGKQPFPLMEYGLPISLTKSLLYPAWSPDGRWITWWVKPDQNPEGEYNHLWKVLVINLDQKTFQFIDNLLPKRYGVIDTPEWSPDSRWFVFWSGDENYERVGIWKASADGKDVKLLVKFDNQNLYDDSDKVWSPNGQWLAFARDEPEQEAGIWVIDIDTDQLFKIDLPANAQSWDWINLEPLQAGEKFIITPSGANLNIRKSPSLEGHIVTQLFPGDVFIPLEGSISADGYDWWRIRVENSGVEGWIVDIQDWYAPLQYLWPPHN